MVFCCYCYDIITRFKLAIVSFKTQRRIFAIGEFPYVGRPAEGVNEEDVTLQRSDCIGCCVGIFNCNVGGAAYYLSKLAVIILEQRTAVLGKTRKATKARNTARIGDIARRETLADYRAALILTDKTSAVKYVVGSNVSDGTRVGT